MLLVLRINTQNYGATVTNTLATQATLASTAVSPLGTILFLTTQDKLYLQEIVFGSMQAILLKGTNTLVANLDEVEYHISDQATLYKERHPANNL